MEVGDMELGDVELDDMVLVRVHGMALVDELLPRICLIIESLFYKT